MDLKLIGYFPKQVECINDWNITAQISAVCSVSECISSGPDNWIQHWQHNQFGFFNSISDAINVIPISVRDQYTIFAYSLLPIKFIATQEIIFEIDCPSIEPLPPSFQSIGFDAANRSHPDLIQFECSPLSCNYGWQEISVNRYCLFNSLDEAINGARRFANEEWEPGDYYVIEIFTTLPLQSIHKLISHEGHEEHEV